MRWRARAATLAIASLLLQAWLPLLIEALPQSRAPEPLLPAHGQHHEIGDHAAAPAEPHSGAHHQHDLKCPLCVIAQVPTALPGGTAATALTLAGRCLPGPPLAHRRPGLRCRFLIARPRAPPLAMQPA